MPPVIKRREPEIVAFGRELIRTRDPNTEIWRFVPGFSKYEASTMGRIRSLHIRRRGDGMMSLSPDKDGYLKVGLWSDSEKRQLRFSVSHLILLTFVGPRPNDTMHACHENGRVDDNRVDNLRWDTPSGNHQDAVRHGTHTGLTKKGEANPLAKLTEADVLAIRRIWKPDPTRVRQRYKHLAAKYSVLSSTIKAIVEHTTWQHLP